MYDNLNDVEMFKQFKHKPIIIALSGFKGSGKDTVSHAIKFFFDEGRLKLNKDANLVCMSFAEPIHDIVNDMFDMGSSYENKEKNNPYWSDYFNRPFSKRAALISIGENIRKIYGSNIWNAILYHKVLESAKWHLENLHNSLQFVVCISDVRFGRELKLLDHFEELGFDVYKWVVFRKKSLPEWAQMGLRINEPIERMIIEKDFRPDPSEYEWCKNIKNIDAVIKNDISISDVYNEVNLHLERIMSK